MDLNNLKDKWSSFGWDTYELDGHDIPELHKYFKENNNINKPKALVANTIKGKGVSFMEGNNKYHSVKKLPLIEYKKAMKELDETI